MSGGVVSSKTCEDVWAENENATCELSVLNRNIYPNTPGKEMFDNDDMTCYIPDTWLK